MDALFIKLLSVLGLYLATSVVGGFQLTLLHTNDVHGRIEQFDKYGSECDQDDADEGKCFGGVARRFTKIEEIRRSHDNVLLLDAGDQFMGTTFFSVHQGLASAYFMNRMDYDAMCLGNHEFDIGLPPLVKFLDNVTFPVVSCNTYVTMEPTLSDKVSRSVGITVGDETIGIIGYITPDTAQLSAPGPTISFGDIIQCVTDEVEMLKSHGVNKIIALGHAGFTVDQQVAAIDGVDIVVGGHTNAFLYNEPKPPVEQLDVLGPYPYTVDQPGGGQGLVVQDYKWGKYLGYLNVTFDDNGVVTDFSGNPILLDSTVEEGNLLTDAIIDYHVGYSHPVSQWAPASLAFWIGGSIRASIDKGEITMGQVLSVLPYGNEIDLVTLKGRHIREQLEVSVQEIDTTWPHGRFLQMSGARVIYDLDQPVGQRVMSVEVRCLECDVPRYSPLEDNTDYKVYLLGFVLDGGDSYSFKTSAREPFNTLDYTTLVDYLRKHGPVYTGLEGRIQFKKNLVSSSPNVSAMMLSIVLMTVLACLSF